jgi:hypothetical protein
MQICEFGDEQLNLVMKKMICVADTFVVPDNKKCGD